MKENICRFIPINNNEETIKIINFVFERNPEKVAGIRTESVYKMYYVSGGSGKIGTPGKISEIKKGDVFFTFPAFPFSIDPDSNLEYYYISFIGFKGNKILETLKINHSNFIFHNMENIKPIWEEGIKANSAVADWMSESVLLWTFSYLGNKFLTTKEEAKQNISANLIKKYIDDKFTNHNFSLDDISNYLSYNKKYISHVFKKHFGIGVINYLNIVRIQNARTLMDQGFTCVSDIADKCGYSDLQYFSRVFKERTGISPSLYVKQKIKAKER